MKRAAYCTILNVMTELRKNVRYPSYARARVDELFAGDAVVKDLSVTGCRLEFTAAVAFSRETPCRITIVPEDKSAIDSFQIEARAQWSRASYDTFEIGFAIETSPKGKAFQRYVDYLSWLSTNKSISQ